MITLGDDGTMDTVVYCTECGQEFRGNYEPSTDLLEADAQGAMSDYDDWKEEFIAEIEDEHVCSFDSKYDNDGDM